MNKKYIFRSLAVVVLVGGVFILHRWNLKDNSKKQMVDTKAQPMAVLSLEPKVKTVNVGGTLDLNIVLDTHAQPIEGVDIYSLHYDPAMLQVIDDSPSQNGIQIKSGTIIPLNGGNIVDQNIGTIKFSQVMDNGKTFSGKGVLGTIHFKAIKAGTSDLKFDFKLGSTVDTNAAYRGNDQLSEVIGATITILK